MRLIEPEAVLETPRLVLEPLQIAHAPVLYAALQSEAIYKYIPEDPPASVETLVARYQQLSRRMSPDGQELWLNWAMRLHEEDSYTGILQTTIFSDETAYLAYILFPVFWGQGYAREGCERVLDLLYQGYRVHKVSAEIDTRNTASLKLIESLGFQRVTTIFNADFFKGSASHEYRYERYLRQP
ncbi:MAG TPA: GNAT family N-acetyltransferase [Ktedonobacteraceae bacterium]|nr:GNAT family N-acetyltransferase [Ktedonobacteraceae bacterium]